MNFRAPNFLAHFNGASTATLISTHARDSGCNTENGLAELDLYGRAMGRPTSRISEL
jgi:hypothetical protein